MRKNYVWETPEEILAQIATQEKRLRKRKKISQKALSDRSDVSYGTIKRFETTGNISLLSLTKIAIALGDTEVVKSLFDTVEYASIEEVINESRL